MYLQVYNLTEIQHVIVLLKELVSETRLLNQACIKYGWRLTMRKKYWSIYIYIYIYTTCIRYIHYGPDIGIRTRSKYNGQNAMRKMANMYFVVEIVHSLSTYSITYNSLNNMSWVVVNVWVSRHDFPLSIT